LDRRSHDGLSEPLIRPSRDGRRHRGDVHVQAHRAARDPGGTDPRPLGSRAAAYRTLDVYVAPAWAAASGAGHLFRRRHVVVGAEDVMRIVLALHTAEPLPGAVRVGVWNAAGRPVIEEAREAAFAFCQCVTCVLQPLLGRRLIRGTAEAAAEVDHEVPLAVSEGRSVNGDAGDRASEWTYLHGAQPVPGLVDRRDGGGGS